MDKYLAGLRRFLRETMAELQKCTWPSRAELFESTILVIVSIIILTGFVAVIDIVARHIINLLTMPTV